MKKRLPAQIMVIVLVLMSILSVIALSVTLTSVRDQTEKTQNSQYQTYYAVGENKLLDFQQKIGREPLNSVLGTGSFTLSGDTGNPITGNCGPNPNADPNSKTCTFGPIDSTNFNTTKAEVLKTIITTTDSSTISDYPAPKDKDILIDLESVTGSITISLSWNGTDTAWSFTVDKTDFTSEKAVYSPNTTIFSRQITSYPISPETSNCFSYTSIGSSVTINIFETCSNKMFLRLRPLMKEPNAITTISTLSISNNVVPLQRTITSTTTTQSNVGSGQDNPTVVLESTYLLTTQPLGLFDYVLRTESNVIKE
jgi:type II secretory pathway pseudopilin PulG